MVTQADYREYLTRRYRYAVTEPAFWAWDRGTRQDYAPFIHPLKAAQAFKEMQRVRTVTARAQELGLHACWTYDDDYSPERDEDQCCKLERRLAAGYTDGRSPFYDRWRQRLFIRRKGGDLHNRKQFAGTHVGESRARQYRDHDHTVEGCYVSYKDDKYFVAVWGCVDCTDAGPSSYREDVEIDELAEAVYLVEQEQAAIAAHALDIITLGATHAA